MKIYWGMAHSSMYRHSLSSILDIVTCFEHLIIINLVEGNLNNVKDYDLL